MKIKGAIPLVFAVVLAVATWLGLSLKTLSLSENLHTATNEGNIPNIQALAAQGADVNFVSEDGITPLMSAAKAGQLTVVEALLKLGSC